MFKAAGGGQRPLEDVCQNRRRRSVLAGSKDHLELDETFFADSYPQNTRHLPIFLWSALFLYDKQLHLAARPF